ncbi:hypothetical protein O3M35_005730 [Rhynocoris fuscipes]|uniref:Histone-lysine N-methyltransferase SETMAR n=1 Tax=Rhynocoris fuscipes TaxID=488301 RepID=A0AAW1DLX9_9HEMI
MLKIPQLRFALCMGVMLQVFRQFVVGLGSGNFNLEDEERSGRPSTTDTELIKAMVDENPRYTVRELADILNIPRTTVHNNYCSQLDKLKETIATKRPELANRRGVVFQHDNARPHVPLAVRNKLLSFDWDVLPHPPYSPDIAPCDYYLFLSLKNSLREDELNAWITG